MKLADDAGITYHIHFGSLVTDITDHPDRVTVGWSPTNENHHPTAYTHNAPP